MFKWWSLRGGWIIWMKNPEWCRKLVPEMRWSMSEGAVSDFQRWWWFDQSDVRWRVCVVTMRWLNRYNIIELRWLSGIESFVSARNDFIFNSFWKFKNREEMCWNFAGSFEKEHSGCVGDDLLDILENHSTETYSSKAWSVRWSKCMSLYNNVLRSHYCVLIDGYTLSDDCCA